MLKFATRIDEQLLWIPPLLIIYNFCANLSNDIYLPCMPTLVQLFGSSINVLQLTMSAWFAGVAIPQLFFGPLTDKVGRRPVLLLGGVCFLGATLCCALAQNVLMLIIARFFQGVGVCSFNVTSFSILADLFDYQNRMRIMNKMTKYGTIAPLIGPLVGGYLFIFFGWRINFMAIFFLALICIFGLWRKLPESNQKLNYSATQWQQLCRNYQLVLHNPNPFR